MNEYEKLVPAECRLIVEAAIEQTRENLTKVDELAMCAFVGNFDASECAILLLEGLPGKQHAADVLAKFARSQDADFILHICEMYMLKTQALNEAEAREMEKQAQKIGVKNMPGNVEGVCFQLETGAGMFLAFHQFENVNERKTFGAVEFKYMPNYRGRFANLLPKAKR
jgi:hypothetical protein